jgi:hypothetical protein
MKFLPESKYKHVKNLISNFVLSALLMCSIFSQATAQIHIEKRMDIPTDNRRGRDFQTFNLKEEGLLVLLESQEYQKGGMKDLCFWRIDTAFNNIWSEIYRVDFDSEIIANLSHSENQHER